MGHTLTWSYVVLTSLRGEYHYDPIPLTRSSESMLGTKLCQPFVVTFSHAWKATWDCAGYYPVSMCMQRAHTSDQGYLDNLPNFHVCHVTGFPANLEAGRNKSPLFPHLCPYAFVLQPLVLQNPVTIVRILGCKEQRHYPLPLPSPNMYKNMWIGRYRNMDAEVSLEVPKTKIEPIWD